MSLRDPNPRSPQHPRRAAIVLSNPAVSPTTGWPVGFWWSELTHPYFALTEKGYQVELFSYDGGKVVADGLSDPRDPSGYSASDLISLGFIHTPALVKLLDDTRPASAIDVARFDALIVAGGQAPMVTMERATGLHRTFVAFYEAGKVACALCHGTAILRYARLSSGELLVKGKTVTGFADVEEDFADDAVWAAGYLPRDKHVQPWRIEPELRKLGANFVQAGLWRGFAVRDGNLVTGQQNFSGLETAEAVAAAVGL
jgi:putative intracellular protease/amidase